MENKDRYGKVIELLLLLASILLMVGATIEIVAGDRLHFSSWFLSLQFIVCIVFVFSFFIELFRSHKPYRYVWHNILFLLLSMPYLNIMTWITPHFGRTAFLIASAMPVLRSLLAISIIMRWAIRGSSAKRLFFAYTLAVCLFTHLSALVFFDIEYGLNPDLHSFGDAVWWAWMGLSTAGAQIFPITPICRVLGAILPIMGMLILPIFTSYILSLEKHRRAD